VHSTRAQSSDPDYLRESDHIEQIAMAKPSTELRGQLCTQCLHCLRAVLRPLLSKDVLTNAPADLPVQQDQAGVDGAGNAFPGVCSIVSLVALIGRAITRARPACRSLCHQQARHLRPRCLQATHAQAQKSR
jgi:ferredoxin